jgi:hypothetical protein
MNIRYIKYKDIDLQRWDHCISQAFNGNIYGYSWYLDSVCEHWDALIEGDYDRVFPLVYRKKYGISYLYQPFLSQQLGLYSRPDLNPGIVDSFLGNIPEHYKLIEIQLNQYNKPSHRDFQVRMRLNLELDLIQSYKDLNVRYSQNLKRNLKQAVREGWIIQNDLKITELIKLFRENRGRDIENLRDDDYRRLTYVCESCIRRGSLITLAANDRQGTLHAGVIFARSHHKVILLFSATDSVARQKGGMPLLIDTVIQQFSGSALTLDFEGSEDENLARFYKSFGATESYYPFIRKDTLPQFARLIHKIFS